MGDALVASGRNILFSICEWGSNQPWLWASDAGGHMWRTTGDIANSWPSVMSLLDQQVGLEAYSVRTSGTTPTCSRSATAG